VKTFKLQEYTSSYWTGESHLFLTHKQVQRDYKISYINIHEQSIDEMTLVWSTAEISKPNRL